jgi:hypothetical protein
MMSEVKPMHPHASTRDLCRLLRVSCARVYRDRTPPDSTLSPSSASESKPKRDAKNRLRRDEIGGIVLKHPWFGYRHMHKQQGCMSTVNAC